MNHRNFPSFHGALVLLLFVFIILSLHTSLVASRRLLQQPSLYTDEEHVKIHELQHEGRAAGALKEDDAWNLIMGLEEFCEDGNEECLRRRMLAEAHLDYIYTQRQHKP